MRSPPYPSDLTDDQWSVVATPSPRAAENCRPRKTDLREVVNAIFYLNRAGCPWRMLPRDFPPWRTVYNYFEGWRDDDTWVQDRQDVARAGADCGGAQANPLGRQHRQPVGQVGRPR